MRYALREALLSFRRAPLMSALGVATIAFSLFSLGLFGLVALNIRDALARVEARVEVRAFFADSVPAPAVAAAAAAVRAYPEVAGVAIVTALLLAGLPSGTNVLVAGPLGMVTGAVVEGWSARRRLWGRG